MVEDNHILQPLFGLYVVVGTDFFPTRYARAGADITQTFTYYSRDVGVPEGCNLTCQQINQVGFLSQGCFHLIWDGREKATKLSNSQASCDIAFRVAREKGTIVAGGIVQTAVFKHVKVANIT